MSEFLDRLGLRFKNDARQNITHMRVAASAISTFQKHFKICNSTVWNISCACMRSFSFGQLCDNPPVLLTVCPSTSTTSCFFMRWPMVLSSSSRIWASGRLRQTLVYFVKVKLSTGSSSSPPSLKPKEPFKQVRSLVFFGNVFLLVVFTTSKVSSCRMTFPYPCLATNEPSASLATVSPFSAICCISPPSKGCTSRSSSSSFSGECISSDKTCSKSSGLEMASATSLHSSLRSPLRRRFGHGSLLPSPSASTAGEEEGEGKGDNLVGSRDGASVAGTGKVAATVSGEPALQR